MRACLTQHAPSGLAHRRSRHTLFPPPASRARSQRARSAFRAARHGRTHSTNPKRLPPAGPIGRSPRLRSGPDSQAATGTPTLPPWAQRPTCVHARLRRALDSSPCRLSPERLGHMPPTDFCSGVLPEHTSVLPKLHPGFTAASCCARGWHRPLRDSANRVASGQGSLWLFGPFRPPSRRPLAAVDLPQPD
jgi:hypothetical protein